MSRAQKSLLVRRGSSLKNFTFSGSHTYVVSNQTKNWPGCKQTPSADPDVNLSKLAEEIVVDRFVKPAVLKQIYPRQGTAGSS